MDYRDEACTGHIVWCSSGEKCTYSFHKKLLQELYKCLALAERIARVRTDLGKFRGHVAAAADRVIPVTNDLTCA